MFNFKPLISWSLLALLLTPADLAAAEGNAGTEPVAIPHQSTQILDEFIRDPHVLLAPDGMYYLTGTTAGTNFGEIVGVRVWRSPDLANWEDLGFVWTLDQSSWLADVPGLEGKKNPRAIWAPELHWFDGTFWIVHTTNLRRAGRMRSTTGRIGGPYEDGGGWMGHRHDPTFFTDTDGSRYLVYAATQYQAIDLSEPAFLSEPVRIEAENRLQGHEGSVIHRVGGHFVTGTGARALGSLHAGIPEAQAAAAVLEPPLLDRSAYAAPRHGLGPGRRQTPASLRLDADYQVSSILPGLGT